MKRPISEFVRVCASGAVIFWTMFAAAQQPPQRITLAALHALTNAQANQMRRVAFEGYVTYYKKGDLDLFVQDGDAAIYVEVGRDTRVAVGDRVLVVGTTRASFRPEIKGDTVTTIGHGVLPDPVHATYRQLVHTELDCRRATIRATVRSANAITNLGLNFVYLELLMDGGLVDAEISEGDPKDISHFLDADIEIAGAVAGQFDTKSQLAGILLEVPSTADIKILKAAGSSPESLPFTAMDEVLQTADIKDRTKRVRVQGAITYYQRGVGVVLQDGAKSLWIDTRFQNDLHLGNKASATGFPDVRNGSLVLTRGEITDSGVPAPVVPSSVTGSELSLGEHSFDLVSVEGQLSMYVRETGQDEYVLVSDGHLFSAIYRHPERILDARLLPMKQVAIGSRVRITGICMLDQGNQFKGPVGFNVLLRSSNDVAVLAGPSPLSVRNLVLLVGVLLLMILAIGLRGWMVERRIRQATAELASIEQHRSLILEEINASRPLVEILDKILEMVSFKLDGAPCWCVLADRTKAGDSPPAADSLEIVECPIVAPGGPPLGSIFVALDSSAKKEHSSQEILAAAVRLAIVAIETQRLHSDLRHRSEFDLLTDIHNRFSLERSLDHLVAAAKTGGRTFALIYIDLDGFKQINDKYGHNAGDTYLKHAVLRMKRQLRPGDMLARIGGDEFVVLLQSVSTADTVKEITQRLEHSFDDSFTVDGHELAGSASFGIAVYPVDGDSKDSLLKSADVAMYSAKAANRREQLRLA